MIALFFMELLKRISAAGKNFFSLKKKFKKSLKKIFFFTATLPHILNK